MRCFIGIDVGAYRKAFEKIDVPLHDGIQRANNYHITLNFWKDLDARTHKQVSERITTFNYKPFHISLDSVVAFPYAKAPELYALSTSGPSALVTLRDALKKHIGVDFSKHFRPHVTLARKPTLSLGCLDDREETAKAGPIIVDINSVGLFESRPDEGMNSYFGQITHFS